MKIYYFIKSILLLLSFLIIFSCYAVGPKLEISNSQSFLECKKDLQQIGVIPFTYELDQELQKYITGFASSWLQRHKNIKVIPYEELILPETPLPTSWEEAQKIIIQNKEVDTILWGKVILFRSGWLQLCHEVELEIFIFDALNSELLYREHAYQGIRGWSAVFTSKEVLLNSEIDKLLTPFEKCFDSN